MSEGNTKDKRRKKKTEPSVWQQRKSTLKSLILLVMVVVCAVMAVRLVLDYVDFTSMFSEEAPEERYPNLYNASRYFFRIYFPDNWNVDGGTFGFMMDEQSGLVAELYPLIRIVAASEAPASEAPTSGTQATGTPAPAAPSQTPQSGDRLVGMMRDPDLTVSFYYREYAEGQIPDSVLSGDPDATETSPATSVQPDAGTGAPAPNTNMPLLDLIARQVYEETTASMDPEVYTWDASLKTHLTADIAFRYFTYRYEDADGVAHTADLYIAVRAGNYMIIVYDGVSADRENAYRDYRQEFLLILEEFRFSVFDD